VKLEGKEGYGDLLSHYKIDLEETRKSVSIIIKVLQGIGIDAMKEKIVAKKDFSARIISELPRLSFRISDKKIKRIVKEKIDEFIK
jgi:hypothetical protein